MIYWFTGQPSHGKTTLANMLNEELPNAFRIDGDDIRNLFENKDYDFKGRVSNVEIAQKISYYLHCKGHDVIVSLVSPYLDQREDFKKFVGLENIIEFFVHTSDKRERDNFKSISYMAPRLNYIDIDTTKDTPEESFQKIRNHL